METLQEVELISFKKYSEFENTYNAIRNPKNKTPLKLGYLIMDAPFDFFDFIVMDDLQNSQTYYKLYKKQSLYPFDSYTYITMHSPKTENTHILNSFEKISDIHIGKIIKTKKQIRKVVGFKSNKINKYLFYLCYYINKLWYAKKENKEIS